MTEIDRERRKLLLAGGAAMTIGLAGCIGDDDDDDDDGPEGPFEIDPGTTIELDGYSDGWEATGPSHIEGAFNPTLILEAGGEYTFEWTNADGVTHDLEIWDGDGNTLEATEEVSEQGESASVTFDATEDMDQYICTFHQAAQVGDLQVE